MKDVRVLYGCQPNGTNKIDFKFTNPESFKVQAKPLPKGHVIAVRITAENPDAGFKPASGNMQELNFRSNNNVWGYFSVGSSSSLPSLPIPNSGTFLRMEKIEQLPVATW